MVKGGNPKIHHLSFTIIKKWKIKSPVIARIAGRRMQSAKQIVCGAERDCFWSSFRNL